MPVSHTLSTAPLEHPAMDYAFLRQEGMRHLERLAGHLWTDFNAHDPGITILEQVCYALTDLAYRINHSVPDLLSTDGHDPYTSLYSPAQILPCAPVTLTDLRKLVVDVEGVKNAWIEKVEMPIIPLYFDATEQTLRLQAQTQTDEPIVLKGLYRVLIEKSDLVDIDGTLVQRAVARRLHAHRNLGEDFEEIRVLDPQYIQVQARIEIESVENAEEILLGIYQRIADYISPSVRFYGLSELLDAGKPIDEIFDGPPLEHGFIDTTQLEQMRRRTALRSSDLIREIMDVPGVRAVTTAGIAAGAEHDPWSLDLDPQRTPTLDLAGCAISLERNLLTVGLDAEQVRARYYQRLRHSAAFRTLSEDERDLSPPSGQDRHVGSYYSFQHQFPATYGIGELGLPASATPQRKAQAKQMKAYLLFFDQLLANYFAQLAHVTDVFSFSAAQNQQAQTDQTYFWHVIDDPSLGLEEVWVHDRETRQAHLAHLTANPSDVQKPGLEPASRPDQNRKNRFLSHLLARFSEQFTDYSLILYGVLPGDGPAATAKLIHDKQQFLQHYPHISSARGTAFNYLLPVASDGQANIAGLEHRLRLKLGISIDQQDEQNEQNEQDEQSEEGLYLVEHILLRPMEGDDAQGSVLLAQARHPDPYSLQLSFVLPAWPVRFQHQDFRRFVETTLREETPAHLSLSVHWLDNDAMATFSAAYASWLEKRRQHWTHKLGL